MIIKRAKRMPFSATDSAEFWKPEFPAVRIPDAADANRASISCADSHTVNCAFMQMLNSLDAARYVGSPAPRGPFDDFVGWLGQFRHTLRTAWQQQSSHMSQIISAVFVGFPREFLGDRFQRIVSVFQSARILFVYRYFSAHVGNSATKRVDGTISGKRDSTGRLFVTAFATATS